VKWRWRSSRTFSPGISTNTISSSDPSGDASAVQYWQNALRKLRVVGAKRR
jgi:hypothetical protein